MSVLLDTNILVRTVQSSHPQQRVALDAMAELRGQGGTLCIVPQNLYELWVVCHEPRGSFLSSQSMTVRVQ